MAAPVTSSPVVIRDGPRPASRRTETTSANSTKPAITSCQKGNSRPSTASWAETTGGRSGVAGMLPLWHVRAGRGVLLSKMLDIKVGGTVGEGREGASGASRAGDRGMTLTRAALEAGETCARDPATGRRTAWDAGCSGHPTIRPIQLSRLILKYVADILDKADSDER